MPETSPAAPALSETELAILQLVATGATNLEIARERSISEATVKKHLTNINLKLGTTNRTEAVRRALEQGLVTVATPSDDMSADIAAGGEIARQLAEELMKARRHAQRAVRIIAVVSGVLLLVLAVALAGAVSFVGDATATPPPRPTSTPTWAPVIKLPGARTGLALVTYKNRALAIGGLGGGRVLSDTLAYDPQRSIFWSAKAGKPTPAMDIQAAVVRGRVVVPGGCIAGGQAVAVTEIYDPQADRWTAGAPLPAARCGYALAAVEGQLYVFGGRTGPDAATASDAIWRYDPETDRWNDAGRLPFPRTDLAAVTIGGAVHVLGGRAPDGSIQVNYWIYHPFDAQPWDTDSGPKLTEPRAGMAAAVVLGDLLYVVGGGWDKKLDTPVMLLNTASAEAWQPAPNVRGFTPQRGAGMAALNEGRMLLLAGGWNADGQLMDQVQQFEIERYYGIYLPLR